MNETNKQKLKKIKYNFDKITSANSTNWKLVLFWIFIFELVATIIEYFYVDKVNTYSIKFPHTLLTEFLVALGITFFVWFVIYNIIFENKRHIFQLTFLSVVAVYFIITNDFTLQFLLQNINPLHFFDYEFGFIFFIELFFKFIIVYLLYQLVISYKNRTT